MKKLCSNCNYINEYDAQKCAKCGCDLNSAVVYKRCPECGREFSVKIDECPDCRQTLIVSGTSAAMIFDENSQKDGIPVWIWIVGICLPVIGIISAWIYASSHKKTMYRDSAVNLRIVTLLGQAILITVIVVAVRVLMGYI